VIICTYFAERKEPMPDESLAPQEELPPQEEHPSEDPVEEVPAVEVAVQASEVAPASPEAPAEAESVEAAAPAPEEASEAAESPAEASPVEEVAASSEEAPAPSDAPAVTVVEGDAFVNGTSTSNIAGDVQMSLNVSTNGAETKPSKVLAKFSISSLTQQRSWDTQNPSALQVKLSAAQGEPFGSATPSGSIEMTILNASAAQVFLDAMQQMAFGKIKKSPEFFVTFELAE
jgi:hypothetical protein